jgi:hypothetical protein
MPRLVRHSKHGTHSASSLSSVDGLVYIETAQHAKQVSSVTRPLHTRLGTHAKLSPPTVTLTGVQVLVLPSEPVIGFQTGNVPEV